MIRMRSLHTLIKAIWPISWRSSGYRPLTWRQKSVHSASHSFSLWTVIAPTTAWKWYDMQSKIISLWCPTLDIRLIFFNCLMYVSLHHCSMHTVKQSPNTLRRLVQELPTLFFGVFSLEHDEKHILPVCKISKQYGEKQGLYHTILTMFSTSYQPPPPRPLPPLPLRQTHPSIQKHLLY